MHFAKLYQRAPDGDAFESLADLADELADAARRRRRANSNADSDAAGATTSVAPDHVQLLLSSRENVGSESARPEHFPVAAKPRDAKGKPMVRFAALSTAASPFVNAVLAAQTTRAREALELDAREELYSKVQQVPWENNILWGIDFGAAHGAATGSGAGGGDDRSSSSEQIIETEDGSGDRETTGAVSAATAGGRGDTSMSLASRASAGAYAHPGSFGAPSSSSSSSTGAGHRPPSQQMTRPRLAPTSARPVSAVASAVGAPGSGGAPPEAFDMAKPRTYRWEIPDDPAASRSRRSRASQSSGSHHDASSSISTATTTATATAAASLVSTAAATTATSALPCPLNRELLSDSWVAAIGWSATQDMPPSALVLDANDARLLFAPHTTREDSRPTLRIPERKIGAAEQRLKQLEEDRLSKASRISVAMGGINVGEDTATGPMRTEVGKKPKDTRVVKNIGVVHHSLPAIKLSLTKPELPKSRLRELHRPRGKFKINERLRFVAARPAAVLATRKDESAAMTLTQIKKSADLYPTAGGKLIVIEYSEQTPPMLASPGMAARILHYWRPPVDASDANDLSSLGKKKVKRATAAKPPDMAMGQVITLGPRDESPFVGDIPPGRMVTSLNSKLYKVPLFPHKPTAPFAPTPEARSRGDAVLFLLCRAVSKGKKSSAGAGGLGSLAAATTTVHVMELPDVFIAGQVEPQMEVPAPNSRGANEFIRQYMSFHILRLFKKASDGERLKIEDIARAFPNQSATAIRKRMKEVATFERGGNDSGWWKKKPAAQLTSEEEIRTRISPESVCLYESMMAGQRRLLDIGLTDIGLTKLFTPAEVNGAIKRLLKRLELRKQQLAATLIEPQHLERRAKEKARDALWKADALVRKLERDIQVARYIDEQLQLTPWNLTNNYVECHLQGKGSGMLKLGGIGDPTGRGEGFSFVRVPQSRAKKKDDDDDASGAAGGAGGTGASGAGGTGKSGGAVPKAVAAVTGTAADLRKLKMKEAGDVLRNLGLAEADIKKLRRWDRVHMIRELSNRATAHGFKVLSKFARDERRSLSAQQQEYRKKCDVIYARQMDVLSSGATTFSSDDASDDGDDDDLDEWEKDIEAGITGGNDMEKISKGGPKNLFAKGGGGLNRSAESLREREDAVELRRLMEEMKEDSGAPSASASAVRRPDVDASSLRSQLRASGIKESATAGASSGTTSRPGGALAVSSRGGSVLSSALATPTEHLSRAGSPTPSGRRSEPPSASSSAVRRPVPSGRKVLKRTTRVIEEDGSESVKIEFIVDERHVARFRAMQQRKERQQKSEERALLRKRKRVLALDAAADAATADSGAGIIDKAKKRKQLQEELKQLEITEQQNRGYQALLETQGEDGALLLLGGTPQKGQVRCTQCGQAGHIRTNRSCPLYLVDDARATGATSASASTGKKSDGDAAMPLKLKLKPVALHMASDGASDSDQSTTAAGSTTLNLSELRDGARKHLAEKKRKRLQDVREQAEVYKRPYVGHAVTQSRSRMPASQLNSSLARVVSALVAMPESELFRAAVDATVVPDYYRVIKQPMDLATIARKVRDCVYASVREFVKDLELVVSNSKVYNGDAATSVITANAVKVLKAAHDELASLSASDNN